MASRTQFSSLLLGVFTLPTAWLAQPSEALACSPPPPEDLAVPTDIPADGAVLGRLLCAACTTADVEFEAAGSPVAGTFETISGSADGSLFLWRPDAPLTPGESLYAKVPSLSGYQYEIVVTDPAAPAPVLAASLDMTPQGAGKTVGCEEYWPSAAGLCGLPTYTTQRVNRATVWLNLENSSQYLYEAHFSANGDTTIARGLAREVQFHLFPDTPAEVCFTLTRIDPTDGSETSLGDDCFSTSALDLGVKDEPLGDPDYVLGMCTVPDPDMKDAWCERFQDAIIAQDCNEEPAEGCQAALKACDPDDIGMGGAGGAGSGGAGSGGTDSGIGGHTTTGGSDTGSGGKTSTGGKDAGSGGSIAGTGGTKPGGETSGGCSVALGPSRSAPLGALALLGLVFMSGRRRSRRQEL